MALVQVSDIVQNKLFFPYIQEQSVKVSGMISSGAVVSDARMIAGLNSGGDLWNIRSWENTANLSGATYNVSTDNTGSSATPNKISGKKQQVARLDRNVAWSAADISGMMAGSDPLASMILTAGEHRAKHRQLTMLSQLLGVMLELNDGVDVSTEDTATYTDATKIGPDSVIDAMAPWDDMQPTNPILYIHGDVHRKLQKDNLIDFQPTSAQNIGFGTYLGMTLVVDSSLPKVAGSTSGFKYTSYILKPGAFLFGTVAPRVPVGFEREELQGDGGGVETMVVRDTYSLHPFGLTFVGAASADTPSNAEFEDAADWTAVYERKNIGITELITNV